MPTRTIAYLRVSTDKQADRGVSLDAQRAKATAYAQLYDLDLCEVIVDAGESAKSLDRSGLQRALGMLKRGEAAALLVVKLDRLTRSVVDLGRLVEQYFAPGKAALLSVSEQIDTRSAAGRLVLNVLAWEREAIGENATGLWWPSLSTARTPKKTLSFEKCGKEALTTSPTGMTCVESARFPVMTLLRRGLSSSPGMEQAFHRVTFYDFIHLRRGTFDGKVR
jgi:Resolvase, N terminal domain